MNSIVQSLRLSLRLSLRRILSKPGESLLAILGIALATAVTAAVISLMGSYTTSFELYSQQPQARQITITGAFQAMGEGEAAVRVDTSAERPVRLSLQDASAVLEELDGLKAAYIARYMLFTTASMGSFAAQLPGGAMMIRQIRSDQNGEATAAGSADVSEERMQAAPVETGFGEGAPGEGTLGEAAPGEAAPGEAMPPDFAEMEAAFNAFAQDESSADEPLLEEVQGYMVSASYFDAYDLRLAQGALFDDKDTSEGSALAVVGSSLATKLFADGQCLDKRIRLGGRVYHIIGILAPYAYDSEGLSVSFDELIYVPTRTSMRGGPGGGGFFGGTNELSFAASGDADVASLAVNLETYFNRLYGEDSVVAYTELSRLHRDMDKRLKLLSLLGILAYAVALAAAVNIFNLMNGRVSRRGQAIGVQRSLGASATMVFREALVETGFLAALGALFGMALSPLVSQALTGVLESGLGGTAGLEFRWDLVLLVGLAACLVSLIFAIPAALGASRLVIVDALRDE